MIIKFELVLTENGWVVAATRDPKDKESNRLRIAKSFDDVVAEMTTMWNDSVLRATESTDDQPQAEG